MFDTNIAYLSEEDWKLAKHYVLANIAYVDDDNILRRANIPIFENNKNPENEKGE